MTFTELTSTARERLEVGLERHRAGDRKGAERMIRQAAALRPGEPTALYLLGLLRLEADDLDEAETLFGEVLSAAPRHAQSWLTLASIRARRGIAGPAAEAYRRFLELSPARASVGSRFRRRCSPRAKPPTPSRRGSRRSASPTTIRKLISRSPRRSPKPGGRARPRRPTAPRLPATTNCPQPTSGSRWRICK